MTNGPSGVIAIQNVEDTHETPNSCRVGQDHDGRAPCVPLYVTALPSLSTAAQNELVGHETLCSWIVPSTLVGWLQVVPLKVSARPPPSTAAQNVAEAQDTEAIPPLPMNAVRDQVLPV